MPSFGSLGKFFGHTVSEGAAFAAGLAVAPTLHPVVQQVANEAWSKYQTRPLDPASLAEIVAEHVEREGWGATEAAKNGISPGNFAALVEATRNAPGLETLLEARRRGFITPAQLDHGLDKARLEEQWKAALAKLTTRLLDLAPIAEGIQRGLLPAPFGLPYNPQPGGGRIPSFPEANPDLVNNTGRLGYTTDDLFLLTALAGNPPGPQALFRAQFRGAIDDADVTRGLVEGRARAEWAPAFEADAREIPSVTNYVEARVRGWINDAEMNAGTARHGMSPEDTHLEFLIHGRPLSWHQVFIGLRRGGSYDGPTAGIDPPFLKALQESNIRPEWYDLAWAQRYTYPAAFVLRALTQDGDISQAESERILLYEGWEPELAHTVSTKWAAPSVGGLSPAVKNAQGRFITAIHKAYVKGGITETQMRQQLALSELSADDQAGVAAFFVKEHTLELIPPPPAA